MKIRSKEEEFSEAEMIACGNCGRKSPPNRIDCIYCGAEVAQNSDNRSRLSPVLREPVEDQPAVTLVISSRPDEFDDAAIKTLQTITKLDDELIEIVATAPMPMPISLTEAGEAVDIAVERIGESGFSSELIGDEGFGLEEPPVRLRRFESVDSGELAFIHFNNDEIDRIASDEVTTIVCGFISENKYESKEKHKRKKGIDKVIGSTEANEREGVIDIYTSSAPRGYRVLEKSFDFSFLGSEKDYLASKNFAKTLEFVKDWAGDERFDESYDDLKPLLDEVWTPVARDDTKDIKMTGFGNFEKKRVVSSTNEDQFLRFSRLRHLATQTGGLKD